MLVLLGDQLIRDAGLAVFELVKNAYDADASQCNIALHNPTDPETAYIVVEDDGCGMNHDTILNVWMEPGTDYRSNQRQASKRSPVYHRLPLGEKGVGRFAVHKLGRRIELITRRRGELEVVVRIDWGDFERAHYLSDVGVDIREREPEVFTGNSHGTRITVSKLREVWTRRQVRELNRSVTSICSPFSRPEEFSAELKVEPDADWLGGLLDARTVLRQALYSARGSISNNRVHGTYRFTPLAGMEGRLEKRVAEIPELRLMSPSRRAEPLDLSAFQIGTIRFDFRIFDLESAVLSLISTDKSGLKDYMNSNGGIRVYRDGVRIFDLGEPGNDWLDLEGRRINRPSVKVGNNQIIGAVHLEGESSQDLVEKTNREGFVDSPAYRAFREAVQFALNQVEAERAKDKLRVRELFSKRAQREPVIDDLTELREEVEKRNLTPELGKFLDRIEKQFVDVRSRLLTAAGPGLTLTVVIHEVEKIIKELREALKKGASAVKVTALVTHLSDIVDGLSFLVRKSGNSRERASTLIDQALFNTEYRLKAHRVTVTKGVERDFSVKCMRRLVISTLMNLIDNSIYWLENRGAEDKRIYLGTSFDLGDKPSLVIADNGPGFQDPPEYLVEPFFTRKTDGMGLGLHIANEIAKLHKGALLFPEPGEINLPRAFQGGAVVAFQFPSEA